MRGAAEHAEPQGARRMYVHMTNMFIQNRDTYHPFAQHSRGRFVFVTDIQVSESWTVCRGHPRPYLQQQAGSAACSSALRPRAVDETP